MGVLQELDLRDAEMRGWKSWALSGTKRELEVSNEGRGGPPEQDAEKKICFDGVAVTETAEGR